MWVASKLVMVSEEWSRWVVNLGGEVVDVVVLEGVGSQESSAVELE